MEKKNSQLIVQTAFLGDCILTFPLIERIHQKNPDDEILFLCRKGFGAFIKACFPYVTPLEVIKSSSQSYKKQRKFISENHKLDHVFCVHKSFRSLRFCMKLKAQHKVHYTNSYRKFLVNGVERNSEFHEAVRILQQFAHIDQDFKRLMLEKSQEDLKKTSSVVPDELKTTLPPSEFRPFDIPEKYVVLAPGSIWETKKWAPQKFASVAKLVKDELDLAVIILGSHDDLQLGDTIKSLSPFAINLVGQTSLVDCKNIISNGRGFVGNDSGLAHMAALFDVPSVAVFGPTHESLGFRPWQNYAAIASLNLTCSPCGTHGGKRCPIKTHDCMKNLEPQVVFSLLKSMISKKKTALAPSPATIEKPIQA